MLSKVRMIDLKSIWMASAVPTHLLHPLFSPFISDMKGPWGDRHWSSCSHEIVGELALGRQLPRGPCRPYSPSRLQFLRPPLRGHAGGAKMQVAGQGGVSVHRGLSTLDEMMDCSEDAPHNDAIPLGNAAASIDERADSSGENSFDDDGLSMRVHLCGDHPSASIRVGAAEGNGSPLRNMSLPLAPLSPHMPSE